MLILHSWRSIADTFGVTQAEAKAWATAGAPILFLGSRGVAVTEAGELWAWLKQYYAPPSYSPEKPLQERIAGNTKRGKAKPPALLTWGSVTEIKEAIRQEKV
ncbi:MAG: hypothetical protein PHN64_08725 [Desulfovibrionaceae bacterium]|nr:hypothetical protein [Desulfovibrionaceae bacterium]